MLGSLEIMKKMNVFPVIYIRIGNIIKIQS